MREAEALHAFNRALTVVRDRGQLLEPLTTAARELCHVDSVALGIFLPDERSIELLSNTHPALHNQKIRLEESFQKEILQVGWPVYIPALSSPPSNALMLARFSEQGYASLLAIPLRTAQRIIGVFLAGWESPKAAVTPHEEERLQFLGDQTAQTLAHLRLYIEQERHLRESEALRRVGQSIATTLEREEVLTLVATEATRLLDCEASVLSLCTAEHTVEVASATGIAAEWTGMHLPLADSLTGVVIKNNRAIRQSDAEEQHYPLPLIQRLRSSGKQTPQSFLAVPLWQEEKPMGALTVLTTATRTFSLDDERLLQSLADQAVHAIINAQLYTQLQDALKREREANRHKAAFFASASHEFAHSTQYYPRLYRSDP